VCANDDEMAQVVQDYHIVAVIIGSDAVLKQSPALSRISFPSRRGISFLKVGQDSEYPNPFWGRFVEKVPYSLPLALMSASSQNAQYRLIPRRTRRLMEKDLDRFGYVSVRDHWTAKMVEYLTRGMKHPLVTPDPVFAFNYNVVEQRGKINLLRKYHLSHPYILLSFHDRKVSAEWIKAFERLAERKGIQCVAMAMPKGVRFEHSLERTIDVPLDPMDWYGLIKHSRGYVGHNMHPIVVALHNQVPFFSFDNYGITCVRVFANEKASKIYHLLSQAGFLKNRCSVISKMARILSPEIVFERLQAFDTVKCAAFSRRCYEEYRAMMEAIVQMFEERLRAKG